jgi:hypothetical protein
VELGVQPAVAGGVVFTGSDDGALHCVRGRRLRIGNL